MARCERFATPRERAHAEEQCELQIRKLGTFRMARVP